MGHYHTIFNLGRDEYLDPYDVDGDIKLHNLAGWPLGPGLLLGAAPRPGRSLARRAGGRRRRLRRSPRPPAARRRHCPLPRLRLRRGVGVVDRSPSGQTTQGSASDVGTFGSRWGMFKSCAVRATTSSAWCWCGTERHVTGSSGAPVVPGWSRIRRVLHEPAPAATRRPDVGRPIRGAARTAGSLEDGCEEGFAFFGVRSSITIAG